MAQSAGLHESSELLSAATIDRHRAIASIQEELEAVDWYDQRVDAATDPELASILAHNRDEEKEHAAMTLEWLRRRDPALDRNLRKYLFSAGPVLEIEEEGDEPLVGSGGSGGSGSLVSNGGGLPDGSLGIGSLRGATQ